MSPDPAVPGQRIVSLHEIPSLVGERFVREGFTVSRSERDVFEAVTGVTDAYPEDDAPEFPSDIVEGFHSLSLLDPLSTKLLRFDPKTTYGFNYGLDRVRFIAPIRIGAELDFWFDVKEVQPKNGGHLVLRECGMKFSGTDGPCLLAEWWTLILPSGEHE